MAKLADVVRDEPLELEVPSMFGRDGLEVLSQLLDGFRIEKLDGKLYIMSPITNRLSGRAGRVYAAIDAWCIATGSGEAFNCDAGFYLPDGDGLMPDAAFISAQRYRAFPFAETDKGWPNFVPDFICEVRSKTDTLSDQQDKMNRLIRNGVQLGWLIDPLENRAYVYRPDADVQEIGELTGMLVGDPVLPGFTFDLALMRLA